MKISISWVAVGLLGLSTACSAPPPEVSEEVGATSQALSNTGGSGSFDCVTCMNWCWRSDSYCREFQSKTLNCNAKLGDCIDGCEEYYCGEKYPR